MRRVGLLVLFVVLFSCSLFAESGKELWLRAEKGQNSQVVVKGKRDVTIDIAAQELQETWRGKTVCLQVKKRKGVSAESFMIDFRDDITKISSPSSIGVLYGTFHLLRLQESCMLPSDTLIEECPMYERRLLNHWDNLDGTIERGYAGKSLWQWRDLPDNKSPRYQEYARANASIGINGTVLNNVNASSQILSKDYLLKVKTLADIFRPYGIRVYLSINFASPIQLSQLPTADPLNEEVRHWWKNKVNEIYRIIPDFGGFLVKANSEGQPGPCDYNRTHAEGANMLAEALKPHGGVVMWRAFVYNPSDADRAKQAYIEFQPLDGKFMDNVIVQIKNGPVDFQPREPYSPLFGAMPQTEEMVEFQITQEYLGHSNHIAFLAPMWKEFFGFISPSSLTAISGVSNIGDDENWCGHPFAQANWYAYGRLAWNPSLSSEHIAREWLYQSFDLQGHSEVEEGLLDLMLKSHEAVVDYMMPLGLHHLFAWGHHYGPEPWCAVAGARPDWMPSYYHRADSEGLGFDRSSRGSNATSQYPKKWGKIVDDPTTCPEEYLLWFHHVPWSYKLKTGRTLWEELCYRYDRGVKSVRHFQHLWAAVKPYVDQERYEDVTLRLQTQVRDAQWWKDACLLYFGQFSKMPIPESVEMPIHNLEELQKVNLGISNYECPTPSLLNQKR